MVVILCSVIFSGCSSSTPEKNELSENAYAHFIEVAKIPRGSDNEQEIINYLWAFAENIGLDVIQDETFNLLIRKPGSKGRENEPSIILQAHMDMVCEKNKGVEHDFLADPIIPIIDGDWVTADGTTLGADDGSGLSIIMAVLESEDISHPPIEAIITTHEETDMSGAVNFDKTLLKGKRLINIDAEDEKSFLVSSAGSADVDIIIPVEFESAPSGNIARVLTIQGLQGGHSGIDIDKGRANANVLMADIIDGLLDSCDVYVSSIDGGTKINAIPRECRAGLSFAEDSLDLVTSTVHRIENELTELYPNEGNLKITLEDADSPKDIMKADSLKKVIEGIMSVPNGIQSMSPDVEGLVQTSNNLGVVITEANTVTLLNFLRSSSLEEREAVVQEFESLADTIGARCDVGNLIPPWSYAADSPLRDTLVSVYKDVFGREPIISAIHAGLECAVFSSEMPDCDLISIGPDIISAHSPDERMSISSYERMCDFLVEILKEL